MDKRIRFYIYWILGLVFLGACAPGDEEDVYTEMRAFEDFSRINGDSVAIVPRKVRLKALQKMEEAKDTKTARNKNVLVIGGSGSGKTRFWLKPNLMQMHSS